MNRKTFFLLLALLLILMSCHYTERKYYYNNSTINKIKFYKRNKKYTYLSYKLPRPEREKVRDYAKKEIIYTFKEKSFHRNKTTFALASTSTMNFGELYRIENNNVIRIDSIATRAHEFILLKLDPILNGEYLIKSRGCRFSKDIRIRIE